MPLYPPVSSGGVSDGDKGNITVSGGGTVWTIDNSVVTEAKQVLADNTTHNVSVSPAMHGYVPKPSGELNEFLNGIGEWAPAPSDGDKGNIFVSDFGMVWDINNGVVVEDMQSLSDVTTHNVSTTKHGYAPKLTNDATNFLNGTGAWTVPAGVTDGDKGDIVVSSGGGVWTIDVGVVTEAKQVLADNVTHNVSAAMHGYVPKAPNDVLQTLGGVAGAWVIAPGGVVYVPANADTAINSVTDITIFTKDITGVVAGDRFLVDIWFTILNNSAATRVYPMTVDFDNVFDIELSTGALAFSSTLMHPIHIGAICDIRSTSLAYMTVEAEGFTAAGIASGGDTAMAATMLNARSWGTNGGNLTGTLTINFKIRSASATATQTLRLHHASIRKFSAVG